jgi:iron(III) transport system permease protein
VSLAAACGWTLLRGLVVALVAVPVSWWLRRRLAALGPPARTLLWGLLLVPFFTPALLTGYAYSNFALSLVRYPVWNEALYAALLVLRFVPVGTVLLSFVPPPPVTAEALYCARLNAGRRAGPVRRIRSLLPFLLRGPLYDMFPAAAVIFLLAFQEFETASLMGAASWTVWLFDAQAGGLTLGDTLRRGLWPAACETLVLAALVPFAARARFLTAAARRWPAPVSRGQQLAAWLFAAIACVAVTGLPLVLVGGDTLEGLAIVLGSRRVLDEMGVALGFGLASGTLAALAAYALLKWAVPPESPGMRCAARTAGFILLLPGLLGSLVVSLCVLWLLQADAFRPLRDTPAPVVAALVVFLLPRAVLLRMLCGAATPHQGLHLARLVASAPERGRQRAGSRLVWQLSQRRHVLAAGVLCVWGYLELTPASLLAPPGLRSAVVRLYEDMHYGRNAVLSTATLLTMLAPVTILLLGCALRPSGAWLRWIARRARAV